MQQHKRASSIAVSILLGTYFLSIIAGLKQDWEFLKFVSPFKYFDPAVLLRDSSFDMTYVGLSAGLIVVLLGGAYLSYSKRDLYI